MEAPDKIYVEIRHPMSIEYTEIIGFDTPEKNTIEYIRKDTLLEWAKGQKAWLKQGYKKDWKNDDTLNGGRLMLDKLISKIKSL